MSEIKYKQFEQIALNWAGAISERDTAEVAKTAIYEYVCENTKELLDKSAQSAADKFDAANAEFWSAVKAMSEANDWRKIESDADLPPDGKYLCTYTNNGLEVGILRLQRGVWVDDEGYEFAGLVLAWMPLPEAFQEKEG